MLPVLIFPNFDPIAISLGPIDIRWYSLAYISGVILGVMWAQASARFSPVTLAKDTLGNTMAWLILGMIIGGRLGYVILYQPAYFFQEPLEIFKVWKGGMSFHGGMIGLLISLRLYSYKNGVPNFVLFDFLAVGGTIGIFFGRVANFINGELWGRPTTVPWGMVFNHVDDQPRHPSQVYEALGEGVLLFVVINVFVRWFRLLHYPYAATGLFMAGYGIVRFFVEFVRMPEREIDLAGFELTFGQMYTLPLIFAGLAFLYYAYRYGPVATKS